MTLSNPGSSGLEILTFPTPRWLRPFAAEPQSPDDDQWRITYGTDPVTGACQITTTPVTGNFNFNPNSFSNVPLENNSYYDEGKPTPVSLNSIR